MAKLTILSRISQLLRANINNLIDAAEDPEIMIEQMIRDFTDNIQEAEGSIAQTIGNLRMLEEDMDENIQAAREWGQKAKAAVDRAQNLMEEGLKEESDKFDRLARIAIKRQVDFEKSVANLEPTIEVQREVVEKLKSGLDNMKLKLEELKSKRDELVSRSRVAKAQNEVQDAIKNIDFTDPTSEINRFEEKIRREEARARGTAELEASSLDALFEELEQDEDELEIEERLAALKDE